MSTQENEQQTVDEPKVDPIETNETTPDPISELEKNTPRSLTITLDSQKRTFDMKTQSMEQRGLTRRFKREYLRDQRLDRDAEISIVQLVNYTMESPTRVREIMQAGYAGDHTGFSWYSDEMDPDNVEVAITAFFICFFRGFNSRKNGSSES